MTTLRHNGFESFPYGTHHCFQGLPWHGSVFNATGWPELSRACRKVAQHRNLSSTARVVVEFHSWSLGTYWKDIAPVRDALHEHHLGKYNGYARSLVLLRNPIAHQMSTYLMWPPRTSDGALLSYATWLRTRVAPTGLQTRLITQRRHNGCNTSYALRRLESFTDVWMLENVVNLDTFCEHPCAFAKIRPHYSASPNEIETLKRDIDGTSRGVVWDASSCDRQLVRTFAEPNHPT